MTNSRDKITDSQMKSEKETDDSLAYARSLERAEASNLQMSADPLAAVKDMRLQQLAACRIKTAEELKAQMSKKELNKTAAVSPKSDTKHSD